jgi:DNA-binding NarL/FixJ family response regulator
MSDARKTTSAQPLLPQFEYVRCERSSQSIDGPSWALMDGVGCCRRVAAERLSPDVIVTDIAMPGIDGIDAVVLIRRHDPNARIVFVAVQAEPMFVEAGLEAGALGYVLKDSAGEELIAAVRPALGGTQYMSRELDGLEGGPD